MVLRGCRFKYSTQSEDCKYFNEVINAPFIMKVEFRMVIDAKHTPSPHTTVFEKNLHYVAVVHLVPPSVTTRRRHPPAPRR